MTALPVATRPELTVLDGGRGRPSLTRLGELRDLVCDLRDELQASIDERRAFASDTLATARRAQVMLAHGHSPATLLDALERAAVREGIRILAVGVDDDGPVVA